MTALRKNVTVELSTNHATATKNIRCNCHAYLHIKIISRRYYDKYCAYDIMPDMKAAHSSDFLEIYSTKSTLVMFSETKFRQLMIKVFHRSGKSLKTYHQ